ISLLEQLERDQATAHEDAAETCMELSLESPTRWSRMWTWLRFGRWRWRALRG
ncbi:MAG: hypothetical protein H0V17_36625, partial [Deltaproteobacteria bacterium]|nr:hypothetical protein [Deltaproteobacteria bacterium]